MLFNNKLKLKLENQFQVINKNNVRCICMLEMLGILCNVF